MSRETEKNKVRKKVERKTQKNEKEGVQYFAIISKLYYSIDFLFLLE